MVKAAGKTKQIEKMIGQVMNYHDVKAPIAGNDSGFIAKIGTNIRIETKPTISVIKSLDEPSRWTILDPRPASARLNSHQ